MKESDALEIFEKAKAIVTGGHFVYTSGLHGSVYVNKDSVYPDTDFVSALCDGIAERFVNDDVDVVVGPAIGGVILSQWTAHHLSRRSGKKVHAVYAERVSGEFVIKRGYPSFVAGGRVLVVEDILTTGVSVLDASTAVHAVGGIIVGVAALCNRGGVKAEDIGNPPRFEALLTLRAEAWKVEECPLCKGHTPVNTDLGHGAKFLAEKI